MISNASQNRRNRIEANFERWLWRFRLISIIPVLMSLLGSISYFARGTKEELSALHKLFHGHFDSEKSILLLGKVVGGIDSNKPNEISFKLNLLKHQALLDNNV